MHLDLWTLALQAINVGVLVWLLARFLFRPVGAIIAARREASETLLADAEAARARAAADAAEIARQRQDFGQQGKQIIEAAQTEAAAQAEARRVEAERAITRHRKEAAAGLEGERHAVQQAMAAQAGALALTIARRLLARVPEPPVTDALIESLAAQLATLPADERDRLARSPIEILTPRPMEAGRQRECASRIAVALTGRHSGGASFPGENPAPPPPPAPLDPPPAVSFRVEPALLAGVELHAPHTLIRNHWQADLERIARELQPDVNNDARPARVA